MYVAGLNVEHIQNADRWTQVFASHSFSAAAYLIFLAMVFDALDGRLARFTRHTTDFGGQLDSLADAISFGAAPAFLAMQLFRNSMSPSFPVVASRLVWAIGAIYLACALVRLARFNVSNKHGEQHHFSFLGLPSPGAGGTVAALVLMQQALVQEGLKRLADICVWLLPVVVLLTGLLMISEIRYPHLVNRYLRGRRSLPQLIVVVFIALLVIVFYKYALAIGTLIYAAWGPVSFAIPRLRPWHTSVQPVIGHRDPPVDEPNP